MRRPALLLLAFVLACGAGIVSGRAALDCVPMRDAIGVLFGRGHLLALACGRGLYEADLERARAERRDAGNETLVTPPPGCCGLTSY